MLLHKFFYLDILNRIAIWLEMFYGEIEIILDFFIYLLSDRTVIWNDIK